MLKKEANMIEARRFQKFLEDLEIVSPIQYFERDGDEIMCVTAQVIIMVSHGKALVTREDDGSKVEYLLEEEGNPVVFRAFREYKKMPHCSIIRDIDTNEQVKVYQIRHRMATAVAI